MANVWVYTQRDVTSGRKSAAGKDDGGSHKARARAQLGRTWWWGVLCAAGPSPVPRLPIPSPHSSPTRRSSRHSFPSKYFQGNRPKMEASSSHGPMLAVGRGARSFTSRRAISSTLRRKESFTALRYQAREPVHVASGNQHSDLGTKALADQPFNYGVISASDAWQTQHQQHLRPRRHRCPGQRTLRVQWPRL